MNVSLRQLRAFVLVAQERSFTRAASRLHVSPSALTITIRELEAEVGMRLFDRTTRSVDPTPQARAFQPVAERLLEDFGRALGDLRSFAERQKGFVGVAAAASIITFVLAPAIAALAKAYPAIIVRVIEDHTESVAKRVQNGEVDFGITTLLRPVNGIDARLLLQDRLGIIFSDRHELAKRRGAVSLLDIVGAPLISLAAGAGIRDLVDQQSRLAAALPRPTYEVSSISALHNLVARNVGVALVPALTARSAASAGIVFRPLSRPVIFRGFFFLRARNRALSPAAAALTERVLTEIHELREDEDIRVKVPTGISGLEGPASASRSRSHRRA
jgi:LysR family transcriptional regulator, carnitine catabolism transcriptional activator